MEFRDSEADAGLAALNTDSAEGWLEDNGELALNGISQCWAPLDKQSPQGSAAVDFSSELGPTQRLNVALHVFEREAGGEGRRERKTIKYRLNRRKEPKGISTP